MRIRMLVAEETVMVSSKWAESGCDGFGRGRETRIVSDASKGGGGVAYDAEMVQLV